MKEKLYDAYYIFMGCLILMSIIICFLISCPIDRLYERIINYERTIKSNEVKHFYKDTRDMFK